LGSRQANPLAPLNLISDQALRDAATTDGSNVIAKLEAGTELSGEWVETGSGPRDKWLEFDFNGKKAFVWAGNLSLKDAAETKNYDSAPAEESPQVARAETGSLESQCGISSDIRTEERLNEYLKCHGAYANENFDDQQIMALLDRVYTTDPIAALYLKEKIDPKRFGAICEAALNECAMAGDPMFCFERNHPYWFSRYKAAGTCM